MAVTKLVEPYVKTREIIREYPTLLNIDGTSNIGGVIVAPTGPRLAYINGPKSFLENYTVDGIIPRNADKTFINAYYMSFSAGLVLARAMNTTAVNGLYFTVAKQKETKLLINADNDSLWGLQFNGVYYWCNNGSTVWTDFIDLIKGLVDDEDNPLYTTDQINQIKEAGKSANESCMDFNDLAAKLETALTKSTGTKYNVCYSSKVGGLVFSPDIDSQFNVEDARKTVVGLALNVITKEGVTSLEAHSMNFKNGVALTESEVITFDFTGIDNGIKGNWAFVYGSMAYYHGAVDRSLYEDYSLVSVNSIEDIANSISGMAGMSAEDITTPTEAENGTGKLKITFSEGNRLYVAEDETGLNYQVSVSQEDEADHDGVYMSEDMYFAIYPKDAQDSNKYKMMVQPDDDQLFLLTLTDGVETNSYTVSLVPDAKDQSGSNAFIENLNALGLDYTIVTNPDVPEADLYENVPGLTQVFSFGDSGLDLSASKSVNCLINALHALEDQEEYDIEYIAPFGIVDLQFIKNYTLVGRNNDWLTPVDIPYQKTNANSIKGYFLNVDNHSNVIAMGPFDKNTGLTGWMNYIACSTLYYTRIMRNKAAMSEFAPAFDQTNGVLDFTNPVYMLGKDEREKLLNCKCPINFLIYNMRNQVYYLNDNWTHQYERNIVSEEQNRRLVNKIKKDCKRLMQRFKGRLNTVTTRADVVSLIEYYFQQSIMNQRYRPNDYNIICDESNNTTEVITANKLAVTVQVRLENAIKYIDVLADVFPLGVDFSATIANG